MNEQIRSYRDLEVWQRGLAVAKEIYTVTTAFPTAERFGLVNQMRRAAVSISANIAEGQARLSTREFQHFISFSMGSVAELETQVILCADLGHLTVDQRNTLLSQLDTLGKMLRALYRSLANRAQRTPNRDRPS